MLRSRCISAAAVHSVHMDVAAVNSPASLQPPEYMDLGTCTEVCEFCGALFWLRERLTSSPLSVRPRYNKCCKGGRVVLPCPADPPAVLKALFLDKTFLHNLRAYNSMFSMTSFGATVDDAVNKSNGPYVFKVSGQVSHWLGSLCPPPGRPPRFLQMYIYYTVNETDNRLRFFAGSDAHHLRPEIVQTLSSMLSEVNEYVRLFKSAAEPCLQPQVPTFAIKLYSRAVDHRYTSPAANTLGAIIRDENFDAKDFDIIIRSKDDTPHRVSKLHASYMPLQYPLLFPRGEQGWSPELRLLGDAMPTTEDVGTEGVDVTSAEDDKLTAMLFYSYQIHDRADVYTHLLKASRLFQQYLVDAYICIEHCRLDYICKNQPELRSEFLEGVHDAISRGDTQGSDVGKRVFLPASFIGGPRYMYKHYQDALALCRVYGNPQYFITFTCNVRWPEIVREISRSGMCSPQDRPDIIARVFQMKVRSFIQYLRNAKPFGTVTADLYTIEFQKRGLPHCHTLLWVSAAFCVRSPEEIDQYISAELPDPINQPFLFRVVCDFMLHGPCGLARLTSPCMKDGTCTKKYPMPYEHTTRFDNAGYVHYKRRSDGHSFLKNGIPLDNGFVVPYNVNLLLRFDAHINVEYCGWSMLIKYLFKYISKGADRIRFSLSQTSNASSDVPNTANVSVDEICNYTDARFICPHEACWRILSFPIHHRNPAVQILAVHLEGKQNITFKRSAHLTKLASNLDVAKTTLIEWFSNNQKDLGAATSSSMPSQALRYVDYLTKYCWLPSKKKWQPRVSKRAPPVGRLAYVHPTCGELFYLRLLLNYQRGCCSFSDVRTVDGIVLPTFREACEKLGLLGNDQEWATAICEAAEWATPKELRSLFVYLLLYCDVSNPLRLWEENWKCMSDDVSYQVRCMLPGSVGLLNETDLRQYVLHELETTLNSGTTPHTLPEFGLPLPDTSTISILRNTLLLEEKNYNKDALTIEHAQLHANLQPEQLAIYNIVMGSIKTSSQVLLFIYGHGGTGKTYLWKTLIAALRSCGEIVLAVAASGIASLLLPAGRTAHSRFKIPIELTEESVCHIKKKTNLCQLLLETTLIIWDEAPMSDRRCFESLDKTLQDLTGNTSLPFGGKSILLGGDFRQTLPVKPKCTKNEIINSSLPRSYLWKYLHVYKLTKNMRVTTAATASADRKHLERFSSWLLKIGDGEEGMPLDPLHPDVMQIQIPPEYLLNTSTNRLHDLIHFIYGNNILYNPTPATIAERALLCPKNETVDELNSLVQEIAPGDCTTYLSTDSMVPHSKNGTDADAMFWEMESPGIFTLRPEGDAPAIDIRVLRKWIPDFRDNELHFLLVDEQGGAIQAVVKGGERKIVDQKLKLNMCYNIDGYACVKADIFTDNISHPAMMRIGSATVFSPIPDTNRIQDYYYEFATRAKLDTQSTKSRPIVDYIGILQDMQDKITTENQPYVLMQLRDCSNQPISVALWNRTISSPEKFNRAEIDGAKKPVIIGITSLKVQNFQGTLQLKTTNASYVYLNPKAVETTQLEQLGSACMPESIIPVENSMLLSQILHLDDKNLLGKSFTTNGFISNLETNKEWYYTACPMCNQTIYKEGQRWFCTRDGKSAKANHMYRILATITHGQESIEATFFDRAAKQLLQLPCDQLLNKQNPIQSLEEIKNKDAQFHIQIENEKRNNIIRCIVNKACLLQSETEVGTSDTPHPSTPAPKAPAAASVRRSLLLSEGSEATAAAAKKGKYHNK